MLDLSQKEALKIKILDSLRNVVDPEMGSDIVAVGLVYDIAVDDAGSVTIDMTLTAPGCSVAQDLLSEAERQARSVEGVSSAVARLVWDPPWSMDFMSEEARLRLGFF